MTNTFIDQVKLESKRETKPFGDRERGKKGFMERVLAQMVQGGWRTFLQRGERKWVRSSVKDKRIRWWEHQVPRAFMSVSLRRWSLGKSS